MVIHKVASPIFYGQDTVGPA